MALLLLLLCLAATISTPSRAQSDPTSFDFGSCPCDLSSTNCDANCCCDTDCSEADREAFTECIVPPTSSRRMCVYDDWVVRDDTQLRTERTNDNLFCVYADNNDERNFYTVPSFPSTVAEIQALLDKADDPGFAPVSASAALLNTATRSFYQYGEPLQTRLANGVTGAFPLPQPGLTMQCNDLTFARFLLSEKHTCTRPATNSIAAFCSSSGIRATSYGNFSVPVVPGRSAVAPVVLNGTGYTCESESNDISCVPEPALVGQTCTNAVTQVLTTVLHTSARLVGVQLKFVLADLELADLPLTQTFEVSFKAQTASTSSTAASTNTYPRSGNPGYIQGLPVLAGTVVGQTVELADDPATWLTLLHPNEDGTCASSTRASVVFGEDAATGCTFAVSLSSFSNCDALRTATEAFLQPGSASHIGKYGNSSQTALSDWVPILGRSPTAQDSTDPTGSCSSVLTDVDLVILTARIGSLENPQSIVVGARYSFSFQTVTFLCVGSYCQPSSADQTQTIQLRQSVAFVDVSAAPEAEIRPAPEIAKKLPEDFFHPFT